MVVSISHRVEFGHPVKLPNSHLAVVERRKVAEYLLNAAHPDNGGKARFFQALGYSASEVMQLVAALRMVAVSGETVDRVESAQGTKYVVDGRLDARHRREPNDSDGVDR